MTRVDALAIATLINTAGIVALAVIQARQHGNSTTRIAATLLGALLAGLVAGVTVTVAA